MEHRLGLRRQVNQPVYVWTPGGVAGVGEITSVSISGAFIATPMSLPLLVRIRIRIGSLAGQKQAKIMLDAHVVRQESGGCAIEWCEFAPSSVRTLIRAGRTAALKRPKAVANSHR
jgi:hypothetical protein